MRFDRTIKLLKILPAVVLVGVMSGARAALAAQATATWLGGTGTWSDPAKWSGGVVPNNGSPSGTTYSVVIDGMSGTDSAGLGIDPPPSGVVNSGTLRASGGGTLFLSGAPVDNTGGLIRVDSTSGGSTVNVSASTVTAGTVDLVGAGAGNLNLNSGAITGGIRSNNAHGGK